MTRTERNVYPAALAKDRSLSKSGLDKSMPKNGAGPHNWGSYSELTHPYIHHNLETAKLPPQSQDFRGADDIDLDNVDDDETPETEMAASPSTAAALHADAPAEQDKTDEAPAGGKQRRMSSMTEEEREKARAWRHGAMNRDKVDLASIARTSGAFSQSPPAGDSLLGSSPVNMRAMAGKLYKY
ncbi:hypothetical protein NliqN6_0406 [Naganishia liquefaciens]|uniref:Hyaluronan/mRNA-binding protein domain-containing protein n=1 Tax=Naganishia liquefaciens TaxID=104408 RepID=A0A8H3TPK8_9TREE|nr:hypothetical protein NliqN6_0406 [Naganishia liquefaciens]